jgi:hypothetical protein
MFRKAAAFAAASVLVVANPISTLETFCSHPEGEGDEICTMSTGENDKNGLSLLQKTVRMTRSDNVVSADTTTTTMLVITKNTTASQAAGVATNAAGDLSAFLSALVTNIATVCICTSIAAVLRLKFPWSYEGNLKTGQVKLEQPEQTFMGWAHASMALKREDVIKAAGLDHWLLLEFTHLSMKILGMLAIPNLLICGPCHVFLGGNRAGDDRLSYLGMANVVDGSNLYWLHCIVVWISVWIVQHHIYAAMHEFMHLRSAWLKEMPDPRSQTILVENIQEENRSDAKLAQYFESMLRGDGASGEAIVESAYVIKDTQHTLIATAKKHAEYCGKLEEAKAKKEQDGGEAPMIYPEGQMWGDKVDAITYYEGRLTELEEESEKKRQEILEIVKTGDLHEVYTGNGFVTFKHRRECEISMQLKYTPDEDTLVVSVPPDPSDVVYTDLMVDETREAASETIGWACVAGLFFGYMPIIIGISSVASLSTLSAHIALFRVIVDDHPGIAAVWDGLVGAIALTLMISFLPTFLVLIFDTFFALKARAWLQHKVQIWYYYFNLVFILLVTAVGSSLLATVDSLLEDPTSVFKLLASTLPTASHFYLNLYPAQWTTQSMEFMRYVPLTKWIAFNRLLGDEQKAHDKAEPEDQDYYGKGSRSARFTIFLVIAVTFCTLSPLMIVLAFIHFALIRLWYGWMFVYAETPKPDLGGAFWHSKLKHVQQGVFIYIVLMAGVLYYRGTDEKTGEGPGSIPGFIAGASLVYMYSSYTRFDRHFHWEQLAFEDIRDDGSHKKREPRRSTYQQPELEAPLKRKE